MKVKIYKNFIEIDESKIIRREIKNNTLTISVIVDGLNDIQHLNCQEHLKKLIERRSQLINLLQSGDENIVKENQELFAPDYDMDFLFHDYQQITIDEEDVVRANDDKYIIRYNKIEMLKREIADAIQSIDKQIIIFNKIDSEKLGKNDKNPSSKKNTPHDWLKRSVKEIAREMSLVEGRGVPGHKIKEIIKKISDRGFNTDNLTENSIRSTLSKLGYTKER